MVSITGESIYANDTHMGNILSFVDTYANWNALFAFACVTFSILGCLVNRKTHKVKTIKSRVFVPAAIVTVAIVGIGIIFVFISTIANFGISINNIVNPNSSIMDHPSINQ
jgi:predicted PurR-regulated permease PerM